MKVIRSVEINTPMATSIQGVEFSTKDFFQMKSIDFRNGYHKLHWTWSSCKASQVINSTPKDVVQWSDLTNKQRKKFNKQFGFQTHIHACFDKNWTPINRDALKVMLTRARYHFYRTTKDFTEEAHKLSATHSITLKELQVAAKSLLFHANPAHLQHFQKCIVQLYRKQTKPVFLSGWECIFNWIQTNQLSVKYDEPYEKYFCAYITNTEVDPTFRMKNINTIYDYDFIEDMNAFIKTSKNQQNINRDNSINEPHFKSFVRAIHDRLFNGTLHHFLTNPTLLEEWPLTWFHCLQKFDCTQFLFRLHRIFPFHGHAYNKQIQKFMHKKLLPYYPNPKNRLVIDLTNLVIMSVNFEIIMRRNFTLFSMINTMGQLFYPQKDIDKLFQSRTSNFCRTM